MTRVSADTAIRLKTSGAEDRVDQLSLPGTRLHSVMALRRPVVEALIPEIANLLHRLTKRAGLGVAFAPRKRKRFQIIVPCLAASSQQGTIKRRKTFCGTDARRADPPLSSVNTLNLLLISRERVAYGSIKKSTGFNAGQMIADGKRSF